MLFVFQRLKSKYCLQFVLTSLIYFWSIQKTLCCDGDFLFSFLFSLSARERLLSIYASNSYLRKLISQNPYVYFSKNKNCSVACLYYVLAF